MKATVGFFEETSGSQSMMRLLSFLSFFVAVYIALYTLHTKEPGVEIDSTTMVYFGFFMIGAFVPKSIQKFAESNDVVSSMKKTETESKTVTS
jgi:hypothetical protein